MSQLCRRVAKTSPAGALTWLPWLAVALLLTTLAFITPVNHDEDQYVAAAWARAQGLRPFGDFMYLQTPLQPRLTALIFSATEGWSFIALRLVNAAAGLLTLVFVYARLRADSVDQLPALATTALLASCVPFLFEGTLPDINVGTVGGASCLPATQQRIERVLSAQQHYSWVCNGRFKGGYITRQYGRPAQGVDAVQLELAQGTYMDEAAATYAPAQATRLQALLAQLIAVALD